LLPAVKVGGLDGVVEVLEVAVGEFEVDRQGHAGGSVRAENRKESLAESLQERDQA
jgi:hypothetical protein